MEEMEPVVTQESKVEVKPEPSRWYEGYISLEDAKTFIKANITTAARSFIAIGFYLKCVRDRELFVEEDYQDVWEFAKAEYGISKSTASRYMSMNDRFSENGNSPNIREEYRAFGKSQLQEMLYLEDDQLEQVKPGDRVEDIRNLRKPKEVPYIELPGQMEIEIDFPDALPLDQLQPSMISQKQTFEMSVEDMLSGGEQEDVAISQQDHDPEEIQEPEIDHFFDRNESIDDAYGWVRAQVVKEYLEGGYKSPGKECKVETCGEEYWVIKGAEVTTFYDERKGYPIKGVTFDVENTRLEREYNFFFGNKAELESEEPEEEQEDLPQPGFYNPDDDSLVDESYSLANIPRASDRHVTMFARWFVQENAGMLFHGGVFYGIRDEEITRMLKLFSYGRETIVIDNDVEVSVGAEIIEFSRGDEDLGICLFQKFANYVRKQIDEYISQKAEEQRTNHDLAESDGEEPEPVPEQPATVPDPPEIVIDGEFVEIPPEPEMSVLSIFEKEKAELHEYIKVFQDEGLEMPPIVERKKIIVAALASMVAELEGPEPETEPEPKKKEQPELPSLKNNDQRKEFIENYTTWPIWVDQKETGERYYRYDLSDKIAMVVKVSWRHSWIDYKKSNGYEYGAEQYYLLGVGTEWKSGKNVYVEDDTRTFYECSSNMSALVEYLKEFQKKK